MKLFKTEFLRPFLFVYRLPSLYIALYLILRTFLQYLGPKTEPAAILKIAF